LKPPPGPAAQLPGSAAFSDKTLAFSARGFAPLSPVHLAAKKTGGDIALSWIRRTRIGGDGWTGEVPLGEAYERYQLRVLNGATEIRRTEVAAPGFTYTAAMQIEDFPSGAPATLVFAAAQISDLVGPGVEAAIEIIL